MKIHIGSALFGATMLALVSMAVSARGAVGPLGSYEGPTRLVPLTDLAEFPAFADARLDARDTGLPALARRAYVRGKAYELRRKSLSWSNLVTLVLPALLTTLVAIMVALPKASEKRLVGLPLASILAGSAALLVTVHTALNCEEYQAECLRLSGAYQALAIEAEFAAVVTGDGDEELKRLSKEFAALISTAAAHVPDSFFDDAEVIAEREGYVVRLRSADTAGAN